MPFTTIDYIAFFAILFFTYYTISRRLQWGLLLIGSQVFYGWMSPFCLLLLWATILVTYIGTCGMTALYTKRDAYIKANKATLDREGKKAYKAGVEKKATWILTGTVVLLLVMLGVFKYAQFAIDTFLGLIGLVGISTLNAQHPILNIILPVGLSFYVFQSIGYCIDVHREEVPAERNLLKHALFVSYFPQIMQGPIGNYGRLAPQLLGEHAFDYNQVKFGLQRVAWGFFKKVMIANTIASRINPCWTAVGGYPGLICWTVILILYAIQLYADFSSYMDIACGCSQMLGIRIDENFNLPYFSKGIPEFWRRWHMTLSTWFKDYLFYPLLRSDWNSNLRKRLAGNKYLASVIPTSLALAVVWFATGLWHGASWGYVVWGVYYGIFMIADIALQPLYDRFRAMFPRLVASRAYALWQIARTFAIVVFGYSIFKPADLSLTIGIWSRMLKHVSWNVQLRHCPDVGMWPLWVSVLLLFAVDVIRYRYGKDALRDRLASLPFCVRWGGYVLFLWFIAYFGCYGSGMENFEYFKF